MPVPGNPLEILNSEIISCQRCPRLTAYRAEVARVRRRAYIDHEYWGKSVPSFGDPAARVLALGLAPGAHGSNRTGRPFTGDGSETSSFPSSTKPASPLSPRPPPAPTAWNSPISGSAPSFAARRPDNKPTPEEQRNCASWLDRELDLLTNLRVVVCLGRIAFDGLLSWAHRTLNRRIGSQLTADPAPLRPRSKYLFAHGAEYTLPGGLTVIASYHPSLQNTNTGKLTRPMFLAVFRRARALAGLP